MKKNIIQSLINKKINFAVCVANQHLTINKDISNKEYFICIKSDEYLKNNMIGFIKESWLNCYIKIINRADYLQFKKTENFELFLENNDGRVYEIRY